MLQSVVLTVCHALLVLFTAPCILLQNGHQECLEYLLQCGNGDLEIDDHGRTLLHHAAYHGQTTCLQYLIDVAGKNGKDITGKKFKSAPLCSERSDKERISEQLYGKKLMESMISGIFTVRLHMKTLQL